MTLRLAASALADAFRCGDRDIHSLISRGQRVLGYSPDWLNILAQEVLHQKLLGTDYLTDQPEELTAFIYSFQPLQQVYNKSAKSPSIAYCYFPTTKAITPAKYVQPDLEVLNCETDLLNFLNIDETRLNWLCDRYGAPQPGEGPLQHYYYQFIDKKNAGCSRLLEIPKPILKSIQSNINRNLLSKIPIHPNCHGFSSGRSTISFTQQHIGKKWLLRMDLKQFFSSVSYTRIFNTFSCLGYPKNIVRILSQLCSNRVPSSVLKKSGYDWRTRKLLKTPHLPQGSPASPSLANLAAFNLDCRLSAFAESIDGDYSRYADDLLFSSDTYRNISNMIPFIASIVMEEGFEINFRKTRLMGTGQQQIVTGIVLNQHRNLPRKDYESLKAIIHNCVTKGVSSQQRNKINFQAHLRGKLNYLCQLNPSKGQKLYALYQKIDWAS